MTHHVVVLGAGPMGLACAYRLLKSGHQVTICEADDRIGGMSASFDFAGLKIERFFHFICKTDHDLFAMLRELGIYQRLRWRETEMGFYYNGQMHEWGNPKALLRFPHLSLSTKLRYGAHVLYCKRISDWTKLDREEATSWIKKWIGQQGYDVLWKSLFDYKFYQHRTSLSAAWIGTRIQRVARSRKSMFQEELGYLDGGSDVLITAMQKAIEELGGRIRLRAPVRQLLVDGQRLKGVALPGSTLECDAVASTIPMKYVPRLALALTDAEKQRIASIENIGVIGVLFKLSRPLTRYFWLNVNDASLEIPGVIEFSNLNPLGAHVVYVPYYMPHTQPKYSRPDRDFVDEATGYLKRFNPEFDDSWILATHVSRYEFAQTVCEPNFFAKLPPMATSIRGFCMADTAYYYPEDRSISESLRVGARLADVVHESA